MNEGKIKILQDCIDGLNSGQYHYKWTEMGMCNCGIVSQVALGLDKYQVDTLVNRAPKSGEDNIGPWTNFSKHAINCKTTGKPIARIFKMLESKGFTLTEINNLEFLRDKRVLTKIGRIRHKPENNSEYDSQLVFLEYLAGWIEVLKEEDLDQFDVSDKEIKVSSTEKVNVGERKFHVKSTKLTN